MKEAIWSCVNQTMPVNEIIIGDDSTDNDTKRVIETEFESYKNIKYYKNSPSLGQANNVNNLFQLAKGEYLVLLHDDDLLLPNAVELMSTCVEIHNDVDAVFGKQIIISHFGEESTSATDGLNTFFYRTKEFEGTVLTSLESGFLQQFPNDAYLIKTKIAQKIGYRDEAGDSCDFDFGLRLGQSSAKMYFTDQYTAKYRVSAQSVSNKKVSDLAITAFLIVEKLQVPKQSFHYKIKWLKEMVPVATMNAIRLKRRRTALRLYFSKWHTHRIFTLGGAKRFLLLVKSFI